MSRILKISAALAVLGAVAGAIGGCLAFALAMVVSGWPRDWVSPWYVAGVVAGLGGGCGVFVAPVLSWTLLREVPIWRCATETAMAASFAGILALALTNGEPWKVLTIALLAAVLAVARLKWAFRRRRASVARAADPGASL